jgi:hypothetical protein
MIAILIAIKILGNSPNYNIVEHVQFQFFLIVPLGELIDSILYILIVLLLYPIGLYQMLYHDANGYVPPT